MKPVVALLASLALAFPLAAAAQQADQQKSAKKQSLSKADLQRFRRLAQDNMAEVELGKLAREKGRT